MATYVLVHGAGSSSWYWHLVVPELRARGHGVVAPDLPCDEDAAGLTEYVDTVVLAIGDRTDLVVVGLSMAGFTAPLVCDRVRAQLLVLVAAMVPLPGEPLRDWWEHTGYEPRPDGDADLPRGLLVEAIRRMRAQSQTPFQDRWRSTRGRRERLGITPDEMGGGHLPALGRPTELAERLEGYRLEVERARLVRR